MKKYLYATKKELPKLIKEGWEVLETLDNNKFKMQRDINTKLLILDIQNRLDALDKDINAYEDGQMKNIPEKTLRQERAELRNKLRVLKGLEPLKFTE